ncbi:MAG: GNAT family N-acetyltransferase [Ahrensia sp.]|nr:GNAT family N-acetyltransferase [Ahrensia sp.]
MIAHINTSPKTRIFDLETPVLETGRLVMRPPHREDIEDLAIIANDRAIAEMTSRMPHPYGTKDALEFIEGFENGNYEGCIYAITQIDTGRLIGMGAVENRTRFGGIEIGYWLGKSYWGKGYASEAASALVDLAFRVTDTAKTFAACRTNNPASRKVLQKQGFQFIGLDEMDTLTAGRVPIERHVLEREIWLLKKAEEVTYSSKE